MSKKRLIVIPNPLEKWLVKAARDCDISVSEFIRRVLELKRMMDAGRGSLGDLIGSMGDTLGRGESK